MKVYHGGYTLIDEIDLSKANPYKDFGKGFYVTKIYEHAKSWADRIGKQHQTSGVVTEFIFHESAFNNNLYKTIRFEKYNDDWLDFVVLNRDIDAKIPSHDYDIVEGPVANDRIASRITDYLRGAISKQDFLAELTYHELTHQICFCTAKSLLMLDKIDLRPVSKIENASKEIIGLLIKKHNMTDEKAIDVFYTSKTYAQLSDEKNKTYNLPVAEIYSLLKKELNLN